MSTRIDDFIRKQAPGAQFVVTHQMLRVTAEEFDAMARRWIEDGGPGFNVTGVPHRIVVDGRFVISRVTVIRTTAAV